MINGINVKSTPKFIANKVKDVTSGNSAVVANADSKISNKTTVSFGASLGALSTEAKPLERILKEGYKCVYTKDGSKAIVEIFDKEGNLYLKREKEITRRVNSKNGNSYITKTEHYETPVRSPLRSTDVVTNIYNNKAKNTKLITKESTKFPKATKPVVIKLKEFFVNGVRKSGSFSYRNFLEKN